MQQTSTEGRWRKPRKGSPRARQGSGGQRRRSHGRAGRLLLLLTNRNAIANKRDPFLPLVALQQQAASGEHLPPGKAGLVIASVRVDGTVKAPNGMLAVVSNPEQRVYFVREGDHLYDGDVEKIGLDGVTFRENSKDAFGKSVERLVTKRIYPSAGEQQ